MPRHEYKLEPTYGPKGGEKAPYVGTCSCGWAGRERKTAMQAAADWNNHEMQSRFPVMGSDNMDEIFEDEANQNG